MCMGKEALASLLLLSMEPVFKVHQDFSEVSNFDAVFRNMGRLLKYENDFNTVSRNMGIFFKYWQKVILSPSPPLPDLPSLLPVCLPVLPGCTKERLQVPFSLVNLLKIWYRVTFSLVPPNFSTKKKTARQPITAAVLINIVTKKVLFSFLFGNEIGGPVEKSPLSLQQICQLR